MRRVPLILLPALLLLGCSEDRGGSPPAKPASPAGEEAAVQAPPPPASAPPASPTAGAPATLVGARRGFTTKPAPHQPGKPAPEPPSEVFRLIHYPSPVGNLAAYLTPDPGDGQKHPAIVWVTGGDCNTIDELWKDAPRQNDQTAAAYRKAGIVLMLPSLRGGNDNPGVREGFFGEVDDVLAAADYLARQEYVDPERIYLGGHSTGGTMVMLVAESSDRFRGTFSFGPASDVRGYDGEYCPFDLSNAKECELRSPLRWLGSVRRPLFVFEGTVPPSNTGSLQAMARTSTNPSIQFFSVAGTSHFSILSPINELIAAKILQDKDAATNIAFTQAELNQAAASPPGPMGKRKIGGRN